MSNVQGHAAVTGSTSVQVMLMLFEASNHKCFTCPCQYAPARKVCSICRAGFVYICMLLLQVQLVILARLVCFVCQHLLPARSTHTHVYTRMHVCMRTPSAPALAYGQWIHAGGAPEHKDCRTAQVYYAVPAVLGLLSMSVVCCRGHAQNYHDDLGSSAVALIAGTAPV